ncbi:MAG: adenylate/guanylate cyclase domain-containing protein, partial [Elusimicrobia bacterium]|nr:adenylate/guanylate cyclase domain-containing protein [Elusimicrobiota bacterium]
AAYNYVVEGRERRYIKRAFGLYLSPEVVDRIADDPKSLKLAGERREISLFFSDIEGFTTLSETLEPERLAAVMNEYLTAMTDIILESGGTLDKYIGDAIMAFWNAPLDCSDHAVRACRAALLNQEKMAELRLRFKAQGLPPLRVRIGLNTGLASVGNMGSTKRFSYTAMGDEVNLASRLEGVNKQYGTFILLSENTRRLAADAIETRELDFIKVKGKNKPMRVYELLGLKGSVDSERLARARGFEEGLAAYRARRFDEAERVWRGLEGDEPAGFFLERIERLRAEPPAADWDGSYALKEK